MKQVTFRVTCALRDFGDIEDFIGACDAASIDSVKLIDDDNKKIAPSRRRYAVTWQVYKAVKKLHAAEPELSYRGIIQRLQLKQGPTTVSRIVSGYYDAQFTDINEEAQS